jgi:hypothetical protein
MINDPTLELLALVPGQLEALFNEVPIEFRAWSPSSWMGIPSEAFTAIEQICHVRDIEIDGYQVRFKRILEEESPTLESVDSYVISKERHYCTANPEEVLGHFRSAREETLRLLKSLQAPQWNRTANFEGYGHVTVRSLMHYLSSHDQQHLAGMQWLLGMMNASPSVRV